MEPRTQIHCGFVCRPGVNYPLSMTIDRYHLNWHRTPLRQDPNSRLLCAVNFCDMTECFSAVLNWKQSWNCISHKWVLFHCKSESSYKQLKQTTFDSCKYCSTGWVCLCFHFAGIPVCIINHYALQIAWNRSNRVRTPDMLMMNHNNNNNWLYYISDRPHWHTQYSDNRLAI